MRTVMRFAVCCLLIVAAMTVCRAQAAATLAGKWTLTSDVSQGGPSTLDLKLDGKKVTGTLAGPSGTFALAGQFDEGTLTFSLDYQGQMTIAFTGKLQPDGSLVGTLDYGQGPANWKAVRVKDSTLE